MSLLLEPMTSFFFFFNDTATTEIYTLSLHYALPISARRRPRGDAHARRPIPLHDAPQEQQDRRRPDRRRQDRGDDSAERLPRPRDDGAGGAVRARHQPLRRSRQRDRSRLARAGANDPRRESTARHGPPPALVVSTHEVVAAREPTHGGLLPQSGMRSSAIVVLQPAGQHARSIGRRVVGAEIGPFAQQGLDEAFGLAVGARRVRPRATMRQMEGAT